MRLRRRMERAPWISAAIVVLASAGGSFFLVRSLLDPNRTNASVEVPAPFKVVELPPAPHPRPDFPPPILPPPSAPARPEAEVTLAAVQARAPKPARVDAVPPRKKVPVVTVEELPSPQPVDPKVAEATQVFAAVRALGTTPSELLRGEAEALRGMSFVDPLPRVVRDRCALAYVLLADGHATEALAEEELGKISINAPSRKNMDRAQAILGEAEEQAKKADAAMAQCRASLVVMVDAFRLDTIADLR